MSETTNLKLFKHDNVSTNTNPFDIETALNDNWDKIDDFAGNIGINTEELILENQRLKEDLKGLPKGEAEGTEIDIEDSAEMRFNSFEVNGNSEQETRSGKNKLPNETQSQTINGLTVVVNDDKTIKISGTATANTLITVGTITFKANQQYYLSGCPSGGSDSTYRIDYRTSSDSVPFIEYGQGATLNRTDDITLTAKIRIASGTTLSNLIFAPMVTEGTTATPYEQYGVSPSPDYPSEVKSCGDNINEFDITKYDYRNNAGATAQITNETTFRITATMNNNANCAVGFKILDLTNYAGKTLSAKAFVKSSTDTNNAFMVLRQNNSDYSGTHTNIFYDESQRTTDGVITLNYKVASTINDSNRYLFIHFYATRGTECNIGDYVDYKVKLVPYIDAGGYSEYGKGCITEVIGNKNKFNKNSVLQNIALDSTTGTTVANIYRVTSDYIRVKENTNYKFSNASDISTNGKALCFYDSNKKYISGRELSALPNGVLTTPTNTKYIRFGYVNSGYYANLMLKEDSTSSTFIEHQSQSYTIPTQQPMRAIGDTRDEFILKENGKWYERHNILRTIFDGNENWSSNGTSSKGQFYMAYSYDIYRRNGYSNYFNYTNSVTESTKNYFYYGGGNIVFPNPVKSGNAITSLNDWKAFLTEKYNDGEPVYADSILTTPTDIECTSEQTEILNKIYNEVKTYKGVTHIYSNDAVSPNIKVNYKKDIDIMINNLQAQILS